MKKIFALITVFIMLTGCDDGDIAFKTFNFPDDNVDLCSNTDIHTYYKVNGTEALVIELVDGALKNTIDIPMPYTIAVGAGSSNKITYKNYSNKITSYCTSTESPAEVWNGTGTLSVFTAKNFKDGKLIGYSHVIELKNITFSKDDETITINNNSFGSIDVLFNFEFDFALPNQDPKVLKCDDNSTSVYTTKDREVLFIDFNNFDEAFQNTNGTTEIPLGTNNNDNTLKFTLYDGTLTQNKICNPDSQGNITPKSLEQWQATSGTVKIITAQIGTGEFENRIYLQDVTFLNPATDDAFLLSDIVETTDDGYFFGIHTTSP